MLRKTAGVGMGYLALACLTIAAGIGFVGAVSALFMLFRGGLPAAMFTLLAFAFPVVLFSIPAFIAYRRSREMLAVDTQDVDDSSSTVAQADETEPPNHPFHTLRQQLRSLSQNQAVSQLDQFVEKKTDFESVLNSRFSNQEITYHRYADSGNRVYENGIHNLQSLRMTAHSIRTLEPARLRAKVAVMESQGKGQTRDAKALRERYKLALQGRARINTLLSANEQALTALTKVTAKLAVSNTQNVSTRDMERLIDDLQQLADRAQQYPERQSTHTPERTTD
jgi:hypothetical protein